MKKKLLLCIALFTFCTAALADSSVLFTQNANSGTLTKQSGDNYLLTLKSAPDTNYFTNRPEHKTGVISNAKFNQLWANKTIKDNFIKTPPNVAISVTTPKGVVQHFVAISTKPTVKNNTISYPLKKISADTVTPGPVKNVSLVFDGLQWHCGDACFS